jgi:hypothetical protein
MPRGPTPLNVRLIVISRSESFPGFRYHDTELSSAAFLGGYVKTDGVRVQLTPPALMYFAHGGSVGDHSQVTGQVCFQTGRSRVSRRQGPCP